MKLFDQPVLQTFQMFIGEMLCWLPIILTKFLNKKNIGEETQELLTSSSSSSKKSITSWRDSLILSIPSICDLLGTTLMNLGLIYTPVSIYQMTRGSIILMVGLLSVFFLKKRISKLEWLSLLIVFFGVFLVGLSGYINDKAKINIDESIDGSIDGSFDVIIGMGLVFTGIFLSASQFVIEEHILDNLEVGPIRLVGYEGLYGSLFTFFAMSLGHLLIGRTANGKGGAFDMVTGFHQMLRFPVILTSSLLIMLSISSFNFFGISLTHMLSATARSTIDTCRTLLVWFVSLIIGWESFHSLQMFAFVLLVAGTLSFNGVLNPEKWTCVPLWLKETDEPVRIEEPIEHF